MTALHHNGFFSHTCKLLSRSCSFFWFGYCTLPYCDFDNILISCAARQLTYAYENAPNSTKSYREFHTRNRHFLCSCPNLLSKGICSNGGGAKRWIQNGQGMMEDFWLWAAFWWVCRGGLVELYLTGLTSDTLLVLCRCFGQVSSSLLVH